MHTRKSRSRSCRSFKKEYALFLDVPSRSSLGIPLMVNHFKVLPYGGRKPAIKMAMMEKVHIGMPKPRGDNSTLKEVRPAPYKVISDNLAASEQFVVVIAKDVVLDFYERDLFEGKCTEIKLGPPKWSGGHQKNGKGATRK
ncbi:hypothetical protein EVAR_53926_1 [Eumeta japonica]|uniref:Uncharacterized protein n=1 Tax=Eumeta variegata TaxID=151549 RepID=A0A4C1YL73_EUMVA|nr:hypothetical protein EVAR_53926_1 [Eumeta japonica]